MASSTAKRTLSLYTVDAFSSRPFAGNPAAVCPLTFDDNIDDEMLQNIAIEMNLSETAFVRPLNSTDDHKTGSRFGLRWFTPAYEVKLCGHATLATAAVLFFELGNQSEEIAFETLSGELRVRRDGDCLVMDFPIGITQDKSTSDYEDVIKSFGEVPGVETVKWCPSLRHLLVRLKDGWSRSDFEKWRCDLSQLERAIQGVVVTIVTTRGSPQQGYADADGRVYDFVSRCFAPWFGVPEDPVTGSAQTVLAHYWSQELGRQELYARQCSARGGEINIQVKGERVHLRGRATMVMKGELRF